MLFQGCSQSRTGTAATAPPAETPRTEPPYANAEPEQYQTEINVTTGAVTERFLAVRKDAKWRIDTAYGDPKAVTSLRTDKDYVLSTASKTYSDYQSGHGFDERARMVEEITRGMLNDRVQAVFEKISSEGGVTRYRKWGEAGKNLVSIISFDEKLGLPVKMEIFKNGEGTAADVIVQLIGFKPTADEALLAIPKDFKLVPIDDMKKVLIAAP